MITADKTKDQATYYGLAADEKPTGVDIANGSCFLEMDSAALYFYDAAGGVWREWGAGA